jgi:hypothetical protein
VNVRSARLTGERGQALVVLLAGCLMIFAGVAVIGEFGSSLIARGRMQRAADLAATAAASSMSRDYRRLFTPVARGSGHISRSAYVARADRAARRSLAANSATTSHATIGFEPGVAPASVTVTLLDRHDVHVPGGEPDTPVRVRAAATAGLTFAQSALPEPLPRSASGGGYDGPLAYRQGKPMRPDVAVAFDRVYSAARGAGISLTITSGFRSDAEQARLFAQRPDPKWVAPPGTSLHRYGTELDLGPATAYGWLAANARRFGFIRRYAWEPWHYGIASGHSTGRGVNPRDVPAQYERGSFEPPGGHFDGHRGLPAFVPARYEPMIARAAQRWNVQPELLAAQLYVESGFNPLAASAAGAEGIAQFMPGTAAALGLRDPYEPSAAIDAQAKLMSQLIRQFHSIPKALAAYNAGPGAVERYSGIPPFAETQSYVSKILSLIKGGGAEFADPAFAGIAITPRVVLMR